MSVLKTIKCKNCQERGAPKNNSTIGYYCDKEACQNARIEKALKKVRQSTEAATKKANVEWNKERKRMMVTAHSKEYKADLQREINKLARMIDAKFGFTTCIDCGKNFGSQIDACHFHGRGSNNSLRYHLDNLHSGKSDCNQWSDKHHTGYITGLENRYGKEYLEKVQGLPAQYPKIKLLDFEVVEKLKIVRKLIRTFDTLQFENAIQARTLLNEIIGIYK